MSKSIAYAIYVKYYTVHKVIKCFSPPSVGRRWVGQWLCLPPGGRWRRWGRWSIKRHRSSSKADTLNITC